MADETIIETAPIDDSEKKRNEERYKQLSEKVRIEGEARGKAEETVLEVTKERDFYAGFSEIVSTNPAAKDHKDEILAKVKGGYTVEDATYAVLGKAGKLGQPKAPEAQMPAGGSAVITPPQGGEKAIKDMSREERKAAILEAERNGDISLT